MIFYTYIQTKKNAILVLVLLKELKNKKTKPVTTLFTVFFFIDLCTSVRDIAFIYRSESLSTQRETQREREMDSIQSERLCDMLHLCNKVLLA